VDNRVKNANLLLLLLLLYIHMQMLASCVSLSISKLDAKLNYVLISTTLKYCHYSMLL